MTLPQEIWGEIICTFGRDDHLSAYALSCTCTSMLGLFDQYVSRHRIIKYTGRIEYIDNRIRTSCYHGIVTSDHALNPAREICAQICIMGRIIANVYNLNKTGSPHASCRFYSDGLIYHIMDYCDRDTICVRIVVDNPNIRARRLIYCKVDHEPLSKHDSAHRHCLTFRRLPELLLLFYIRRRTGR